MARRVSWPLYRFIPARAGNTLSGDWRAALSAVHPRSRGEHMPVGIGRDHDGGSSPLARGTLLLNAGCGVTNRFIPARAGNTPSSASSHWTTTVHPRSRGEHFEETDRESGYVGSSPLARGTHARRRLPWRLMRFIPARAGNTAPPYGAGRGGTVHPRSRGEHRLADTHAPASSGSSPLARGTRLHAPGRHDAQRFIPARAGNTTSRAI